jgi:malonyl-CoA O-methyltransferase
VSAHNIDTLLLNDLVGEAEGSACQLAREHCQNVQFTAGAIEQLALPQDLDLVASASTLQWVRDGRLALERLGAALKPGGYLALSTFGTSHFHELVALGSDAAAPNYSDAETLAAWLPAGMELVTLRQAPVVLNFATASQVLRHLRATGVNARSGCQWSKRMLAEFDADYRNQFGDGAQLPLTYDTVWMVARKV